MELLNGEFENYDYSFKVVLLGKSSIGKSIFSSRLISINYSEFKKRISSDYIQTVGFDFVTKCVKINNKIIKLQIYDCCGNEIYSDLIKNFYKPAKIFLIFYDSNDRNSFEKAKFYFDNIKVINREVDNIYFLIRIKYELKNKENKDFISDEEALEYANEKGAYFCHIAVFEKYETGIYELFKLVFEKLINYFN